MTSQPTDRTSARSRGGASSEWPRGTADGRSRNLRGHGAKADATRERAILALLSERTIGLAAERCGIAERTLRRWMIEDESFQADLGAARRSAFEAGLTRIQALTGQAVDTLQDLLNAARHLAVRLGAARTVLELSISRQDADTIFQRLADLERRLGAGRQGVA